MTVSLAQQKYHRAKIHYKNGDKFVELMNKGVPMDHGTRGEDNTFESDFSDDELAIAKELGLKYDIVIEDIQQYYLDQNDPNSSRYVSEESVRRGEFTCKNGENGKNYPTPKNFNQGSMGGYLTYSEMLQELDDMYKYCQDNGLNIITKRADNINPDKPDDLKTEGGNYQQWVKLSDNVDKDESIDEPQMLYTAIHHAREAMSLQQLIYYMWYLVENYKTDPEIKALVDNTEIYFIPCLNPDGYLHNQKTNPKGGGMWRKNRRGGYGVDNNRNYSYIAPNGKETWGTTGVSKTNKKSDTYCGTAPFSEPENRAMRYFIETHEFVININNHSYSDLLLLPFGYAENKPTPDNALYKALSAEMVSLNGYGNVLSSELYPASGVSDDFIYGNLKTADGGTRKKIIAMTPEIGGQNDGAFWPAKNLIDPICKEMMYLNLTALRAARNYATFTDNSPSITEKTVFPIPFSLKRIGVKEPANFKVSFEAISNNIESISAEQSFSNLKYGEVKNGEITINLKPSIKEGESFIFKVHNDNGQYVTTKTITKTYGTPTIVLEDNAEDLKNWKSKAWKVTTKEFKSSPSSFTDSPNGKYKNDSKEFIELLNEDLLDLTDSTISEAILSFHAKWDIEKGRDYVQIETSTDGSTWTPLCGNYSNTGTKFQKGAEGEPVYDGKQSEWIPESISLNDYIGKKLRLRFTLVANSKTNADGFYFDDLKVSTIKKGLSVDKNNLDKFISIYPNPVKNQLTINTTLPNFDYRLSNIQGQILLNNHSDNNIKIIDYSNYASGIYLLTISSDSKQKTYKIIK